MSTTSSDHSSTQTPGLLVQRDDGVVTITLDRPDAGNELSGAMFDALLDLFARETRDPSASVLLLRANGAAFCTGRERAARDIAGLRQEAERIVALKRALRRLPLVTIARVHGAARGFGMGLAILCDFAIVARSAELQFPEMRKGLPPAAIMSYLTEYALPRHGFPLVLFGDPFTAEYAKTIGLVNEVVDDGALDGAVDALIAKLRALDPDSMRACKELFGTMAGEPFDRNCRLAVDALTVASATLLRNA